MEDTCPDGCTRIDWFWLLIFPTYLVRGFSNKEVKFQNNRAILVQIALLLISQLCNQNQSMAPLPICTKIAHLPIWSLYWDRSVIDSKVPCERLSISRTTELASKIGSSNQSFYSQKSVRKNYFCLWGREIVFILVPESWLLRIPHFPVFVRSLPFAIILVDLTKSQLCIYFTLESRSEQAFANHNSVSACPICTTFRLVDILKSRLYCYLIYQ